jgi:hydrophobic/amphiphilic exporter-1 (mainly G- bacteria), HAE1 family
VVSQCLTLYITPVVYLYLESAHQWYLRKHSRHAAIQTGTKPATV